ncbi:Nn.00g049090.m01.CDS01 [Neocucurbitaria sp. VM-36]
MDPNSVPTNTEAELESFRQKWREEVTARAKGKAPVASTPANHAATSSKPPTIKGNAPDAASHSHIRQQSVEDVDAVVPHVYYDLGEKQHGRRLDETSAQTAAALAAGREPTSALEHYEKAVEKETQGSLGDSVNLYRKAFKLDSKVHEVYKAKHFPPSYFKKLQGALPSSTSPGSASSKSTEPPSLPKPQDINPSNASATVPNTAHHSLTGLSSTLQSLISDFSVLSIQGEPPPTDLSPPPPCPISTIPEEILAEILEHLAIQDVASFVRLAQVCKRLAYLVVTEDRVWKRLALGHEYGFAAMHYTFSCQVDGQPLGDDDQGGHLLGSSTDIDDYEPPPPPRSLATITQTLVPTPYPTYRTLFRQRPRIRFNGCYISTVNYTRPGQSSPTSVTWNSPIHIVTYYRYLRFLRDGTCISLLTTSEPADVVPYLYVEHMHKSHGGMPSAPMKDALLGRWRMSGPDGPTSSSPSSSAHELGEGEAGEKEGTLIVETAGAAPHYMYKMVLSFGSAGRGVKNNKLNWQGYWSYNRVTDDWGTFGLKNDRPFYWSRVRSYGLSWDEGGMKKVK